MQIIGVLDLLGGRAVHAHGGQREFYAPISAVAGTAVGHGDAVAIARAYLDRLGIAELYVADLDAIAGRPLQEFLIAALASLGVPVWVDAGVASSDQARRVVGLGASCVIVGLETLTSFGALEDVCAAVGSDRVAFSLDLRDGQPIATSPTLSGNRIPVGEPTHRIAARAAQAGAGAVIVIDLARVGAGTGLDLGLVIRVRRVVPALMLIAGGGIRGMEDLRELADTGCDAALVATALHDGRLGAADVAAARRYASRRR